MATTNTAFKVKNGLELGAFDKVLSPSDITDIFIYDTRNDSDGGAWRKRTQHTAWYQEELNTTLRGSRREFPAVALIVLQETGFVIYDADDPDLPMWWTSSGTNMGGFGMDGATSVVAMNGMIVIGQNDSTPSDYDGLRVLDFIRDDGWWTWGNLTGIAYQASVSLGLSANQTSGVTNAGAAYFPWLIKKNGIISDQIHDVAITVLPSAPIDPDTGLPTPTIALATTGGTSIIRDDGVVVDITDAGNNYHTAYTVAFDEDYVWIGGSTWVGQGQRAIYKRQIRGTDSSVNITSDRYFTSHTSPGLRIFESTAIQKMAPTKGGLAFTSYNSGNPLYLLHENKEDLQNGLLAFINKDYNTGWMLGSGGYNGGCVMATCATTTDANVTGTELATNGTFDSNTTGWTGNSATLSQSNGELVVTGTATVAANQSAGQTITHPQDAVLVVTFEITELTANSGAAGITASAAEISENNGLHYWYPNSVGIHTTTVRTTGTSTDFTLHAGTNVGVITKFDNFSVRVAELDRSVEDKGFQVHGTIYRDPIAYNTELSMYSGWSSSNFLEQPYNGDLNIGDGDFSVVCWVKGGTDTSYRRFFSYEADGGQQTDDNAINIKFSPYGEGLIYAYLGNTEGSVNARNIKTNKWYCIVFQRKAGMYEIWANGIKGDSVPSTRSKGGTTHRCRIGYGVSNSEPFTNGYLSLLRFSKSAFTPEQINKIYEDEKHLFQRNAKCTLAGTSNGIRNVAYDKDTELLHVGTTQARSVFKNLELVDEADEDVGGAISASNGLVAAW